MTRQRKQTARRGADAAGRQPRSLRIRESWQVMAVCRDERHQREIYELLTARGVKCRLLAL